MKIENESTRMHTEGDKSTISFRTWLLDESHMKS